MHITYVLLLLLPGMFLSLPDDARAVASWRKKKNEMAPPVPDHLCAVRHHRRSSFSSRPPAYDAETGTSFLERERERDHR